MSEIHKPSDGYLNVDAGKDQDLPGKILQGTVAVLAVAGGFVVKVLVDTVFGENNNR